jgi:hypothetical protein
MVADDTPRNSFEVSANNFANIRLRTNAMVIDRPVDFLMWSLTVSADLFEFPPVSTAQRRSRTYPESFSNPMHSLRSECKYEENCHFRFHHLALPNRNPRFFYMPALGNPRPASCAKEVNYGIVVNVGKGFTPDC